jgi:hypothetical protein
LSLDTQSLSHNTIDLQKTKKEKKKEKQQEEN